MATDATEVAVRRIGPSACLPGVPLVTCRGPSWWEHLPFCGVMPSGHRRAASSTQKGPTRRARQTGHHRRTQATRHRHRLPGSADRTPDGSDQPPHRTSEDAQEGPPQPPGAADARRSPPPRMLDYVKNIDVERYRAIWPPASGADPTDETVSGRPLGRSFHNQTLSERTCVGCQSLISRRCKPPLGGDHRLGTGRRSEKWWSRPRGWTPRKEPTMADPIRVSGPIGGTDKTVVRDRQVRAPVPGGRCRLHRPLHRARHGERPRTCVKAWTSSH